MKFFPPPLSDIGIQKNQLCDNLHSPRVVPNYIRTAKRQDDRRRNDEMWEKEHVNRKANHSNETNVFKRRRLKKSHFKTT